METTVELLLFAAPEMGHLLAEFELGRRLISLHPQISISILIPKLPSPNATIAAFIQSSRRRHSHRRISLVELPVLNYTPPESTSPALILHHLATLCKPAVKRVAEDSRRRRKTVAGIVFDMFCTPMVEVAEELGVPSYLFFSSGANLLSMILEIESLAFDDLPALIEGLPPESTPVKLKGFRNPVPVMAWPIIFLNKELWALSMGLVSQYRKAKGILVNTFSELEPDLLESLSNDEIAPPVYSVGPILHLPRNSELTEEVIHRDPVLSWLDLQPAESVVFFCFGSKVGSFEKVQVEQLAAGIERSGHRFLWSVRGEEPLDEVLPEGFLDRTVGVGRVIGWAPQTEVLGHMAVGAFVSHCGWNSVLESVWFGVPLVVWPMYAEQQLNAFVLVRELGLAVDLKMDYKYSLLKREGSVVVGAAEVEAAIRRAMEEEEGVMVRRRTKEMSELARKSMEVGGSSYLALSTFLENVIKDL